jgi:hypothetical protein
VIDHEPILPQTGEPIAIWGRGCARDQARRWVLIGPGGYEAGRVWVVDEPRVPVFVMEGHDIVLYPSAEEAADSVEGFDAFDLEYFGTDGTVYTATVEGPAWGPVTLHPAENRLDELVARLRAEASSRRLPLPEGLPDDPQQIWDAVIAGERERPRRRWISRHPRNDQSRP